MVLETVCELAFGVGVLGVGLFGIFFLSPKDRVRHTIFSLLGIVVIALLFIRWGDLTEFWELIKIIILSVSGLAVGAGIIGILFLALAKGGKKKLPEKENR
jgi:small-conductance mechanosensitive channel